MCTDRAPDPRDEIEWGLRALRALRDLVQEAGRADDRFDLVRPFELGELLDMVTRRLDPAAERLRDYVPRGQPLA